MWTCASHSRALARFALVTFLGYAAMSVFNILERFGHSFSGIKASLIAQETLCLSSHCFPGDAPVTGGRECCRTHLQALSSKALSTARMVVPYGMPASMCWCFVCCKMYSSNSTSWLHLLFSPRHLLPDFAVWHHTELPAGATSSSQCLVTEKCPHTVPESLESDFNQDKMQTKRPPKLAWEHQDGPEVMPVQVRAFPDLHCSVHL